MSQQEGKIIKYIMYFRDNGAAYKGGKEEEQREGEEEVFGGKAGRENETTKNPSVLYLSMQGEKMLPRGKKA